MKIKKSSVFVVFFLCIYNICFAQSNGKKEKVSNLIMKEVFDVLQSQSRDAFLKLYPRFFHDDEIADAYSDYEIVPEEAIIHWYSYRDFFYYSKLEIKYESDETLEIKKMSKRYLSWNYGSETLTITCEPYFMTINSFSVDKNNVTFNINSIYKLENKFNMPEIEFNEWEHNVYNAKIIIDGDYVNLYINDIFIHEYCYVNEETLFQYYNVIQNNNCDLSKVAWPRHADGTSEYDDKIIIPEPIILSEILERCK